ncbi:translocase of chloroplast 159, chloroplastic-like isoform X2 [Silene latifolia]|uniref:translocase of chloroplast 159, chloroplastic-like isoform X2 n=1 Tax=Silene latifolia TaxID=37657 RepID=UPI003D7850FA
MDPETNSPISQQSSDEEKGEKMVGIPQNDVLGSESVMGSESKTGEKDVDDDENEVGSGEVKGLDGVEKDVLRVRVSGGEEEEEEGGEEWGDPLERLETDTPKGEEGVEEDTGVESFEEVDNSVELVDELDEDAVVDSINVNAVEAVRSGVAVVGVDDKKESEVEPVGDGSIGEKSFEVESVESSSVEDVVVASTNEDDSVKDSKVEVEKASVVEESAPVDSGVTEATSAKYTDEGDAVVDSIKVDAAEAVRSSIAVVGEVEEGKSSVVENVTPAVEDSVTEKPAMEDSAAIENGEAKSVAESEAVRSGVAVVGESEVDNTEHETKEVEAPVVKNVTLANDSAPLADPITSEVVDRSGDELEGAQTNDAEEPQSVVEDVTLANEFTSSADTISSEVIEKPAADLEEAQTNDVEAPRAVEIAELLNTEKTKSETDIVSKEQEPSDDEKASSVNGEGEKPSQRSYASVLVDGPDSTASDENLLDQTRMEAENEIHNTQEKDDDEGSATDEEDGLVYFGNGSSSRKDIEELETHDSSEMIDGQVVTDTDEGDSDEEGEGNELFDSAALAALLKAATGAGTDPGTITVRSQDGSRLFSLERPVGLEPSLRSARPTTGSTNSGFFNPTNFAPPPEENLSEEDKKKLQNLQQLKVKFLRLVQRVGFTAEHSLAAQVLYKLAVFAGRPVSPAYSLDNAKQTAAQLEAEGKELDFSLNILVLGKSGVGKSAIINSILGEEKVKVNAFETETTSVNAVYGDVDGVKIRFIDAPGLRSSAVEQGYNRKVLASVKKLTNKYPPDVMFYVDRLDSQTRDLNDLPLLKTITNSLGASIWRNAIITLTHASSAPPDSQSGTLSYEVLVAQRSHIVQQLIGQAVGEMRLMNLNMTNPVSLVENHSACRKNREGQKILPNGQAWRPQLLLLCYSVKIFSEANASSKTQDAFDPRKLFGFRSRSPPLPYLLSSLLQPRAHPKLSADQGGDSVDSDIDLDDVSDSDQEEEEEYDQLPPFKPLKKSQMAKLSSDQKKAYFEEYDYRVKLLQRKQWREELKRMREAKKGGKDGVSENPEEYDGENGAPAAVPVPLPDMTLPPSFDSDNPAYRYRFLEPTSQFLARPVLDPHGWDHDCGYEGVNVEHTMGIAERFPASFTVQVNKDKKDFNVHLDSAVSAKHGENGSSLVGFDVQTIGKQYAYIVRGESKFKNLKKNKTAAGVTVTFLGENVATGVKVEDQIMVGKRLVLVGSTGTVRSQKDAAYGANLEVRLREADYPIGQEQSSFTLSLMKWRGDLAVGANLQSQISVGRNSKMAVRAALNNKMSGQVTVRTSSSDHLSLALAGLMPIAVAIYRKIRPADVSENYSIY